MLPTAACCDACGSGMVRRYHSHPHITVLPSHVDVRTQASYQLLDRNFVGLIISAFNEARHPGPAALAAVPLLAAVRAALSQRRPHVSRLPGNCRKKYSARKVRSYSGHLQRLR